MKFWLSVMAMGELDQYGPVARAAEEAGFHGITCADHLVMPTRIKSKYPYTPDGEVFWPLETPWPDPWVMLAIMGAATSRLKLVTNIYLAALRDPFTAAKSIGTVAACFEGRAICGLSAGWIKEEYELANVEFESRGKRLDELIVAMRTLWTGKTVSHHGRFFNFDDVIMQPAPRDYVPVWCGGGSEGALRRSARNDGWLGLPMSVADNIAIVEKMRGYRREAGLPDAGFTPVLAVAEPLSPEAVRRLEDAGIHDVSVMPWLPSPWDVKRWTDEGDDFRELSVKQKALARFSEEVIGR